MNVTNLLKMIASIGALLLIVGVLPFTPAVVGSLIFLSMCDLEFEV